MRAQRVSADSKLNACTSASNCATPGVLPVGGMPGSGFWSASVPPGAGDWVGSPVTLELRRELGVAGGGVMEPGEGPVFRALLRPVGVLLLATITRARSGSNAHGVVYLTARADQAFALVGEGPHSSTSVQTWTWRGWQNWSARRRNTSRISGSNTEIPHESVGSRTEFPLSERKLAGASKKPWPPRSRLCGQRVPRRGSRVRNC